MKKTFCDMCNKEVSFMQDIEGDVPYELVEFDLCNDCIEEVIY